jgi:hypothetical protein
MGTLQLSVVTPDAGALCQERGIQVRDRRKFAPNQTVIQSEWVEEYIRIVGCLVTRQ